MPVPTLGGVAAPGLASLEGAGPGLPGRREGPSRCGGDRRRRGARGAAPAPLAARRGAAPAGNRAARPPGSLFFAENFSEVRSAENEDEKTGVQIITKAIEAPIRQIVANAGGEGAVIVSKIQEGNADFGYNAKTETFENMHAAGIIDPTKVTRVALENAASVAGMLLTTECVLADIPEDTPMPPMGGGGMPGMM